MTQLPSFTDDYLLYLLAQASAEASAQFHGELKKKGIPVLNWRILASLHPDNMLTIGKLASHALAHQTTLTRAVDRLEKQGLVRRVPVAAVTGGTNIAIYAMDTPRTAAPSIVLSRPCSPT